MIWVCYWLIEIIIWGRDIYVNEEIIWFIFGNSWILKEIYIEVFCNSNFSFRFNKKRIVW